MKRRRDKEGGKGKLRVTLTLRSFSVTLNKLRFRQRNALLQNWVRHEPSLGNELS